MGSRALRWSTLLVGLMLVAACGSGGHFASPTATPTAAGSSSVGAGRSPGVAPATGRQIGTDLMTYRLPTHGGWVFDEGGRSAEYFADGGLWSVHVGGAYVAENGLAGQARSALHATAGDWPNGTTRMLADRVVDGRAGYVIVSQGPEPEGYVYLWGTVVGHQWTYLTFQTPKKNDAATKWIESILASVHWKR